MSVFGKSRAAVTLLAVLLVLTIDTASARARMFDVPCSGTSGDVASLVADIGTANSVGGSNTVSLGAGCIYTLTSADNNWYGPNGLPAITSNLTIEGNGATLSRASLAPKFRLFFVGADPTSQSTLNYTTPGAGNLTLRNITLSDGFAQGGDSNGGGGGAGMGGAIFNQGTVTIIDSTLTANQAHGGSAIDSAAGGGGGGIGASAAGVNGGGFGTGSFGGAVGGGGYTGGGEGGAGGAGFGASDNGAPATGGSAGAGGGPSTGLGGPGGTYNAGALGLAGDGGGGGGGGGNSGSATTGDGSGGNFGAGGAGTTNGGYVGGGGGGVGGGGGQGTATAGGGGGFGGGGGAGRGLGGSLQALAGGGSGGFGGGGGGVSASGPGATAGASGYGGGYGSGASGGGGAGMGGAIFNMQGTLVITNSTLASNSAIGGSDNVSDHAKGIAGAVFNMSGSFTATGSTFARNTASVSASQIYDLVYDGYTARTAQVTLLDTIVAGGTGPFDIAADKPGYITPANLGSAILDVSQFDLVGTIDRTLAGTVIGTPLSTDPMLGPLQDNGGPTQTMALLDGSPAIDAGTAAGVATDQRGDPRPVDFSGLANAGGDGADIGAFEVQGACATATTPIEACHRLAVILGGGATGTVASSAISCPGTCSASLAASRTEVLTATPAAGSMFLGWSGACTGGGACRVAMTQDQTVTATFAAAAAITNAAGGNAPSLSNVKESAAAWRESKRPSPVIHKKQPPTGTVYSFDLNEAAGVTVTFTRVLDGRKVGAGCVVPTAKNKGRSHCARMIAVGSLVRAGHPGSNSISFLGSLAAHSRLAIGRYTATFLATDAAGERSAPQSLSFTIVR